MFKLARFTTGIRSKLLFGKYKGWLKKGDRVLDVGCGDGILSSIIIEKFKINLTGCDIENYLKTPVPFIHMANKFSLPFPDKSFNKIMFNDVFHHMSFENQEKLLKEALRVSDHVLIFEVEPTLIGSLADYIINKFHSLRMETPLTFRSSNQWLKLFEDLSVSHEFRQVKRPLFYPFTHEAFYLHVKKGH